nr:Immunoglobulin and Immunoglobulin V-set domain containing protein [Haemonchus contortus]
MKDGTSINDLIKTNDKGDFIIDGSQLTLSGGKLQLEGDYQCIAEVSGVRLSNRQVVKTTLVSDPLKLRRARITKFDQTTNHYVHVNEGQVARLPCAGLPDVVPGPAEICFIKSGSDSDGCLSDKTDSNYLSTSTGMQISVVQPHHAGEYYCVVRNEYTKQTRKSPRYVKLRVNPAENETSFGLPAPPQLVFPSKENRPDSPIVVDVVTGQDVILECVFVRAKVIWIKHGDSTPEISLLDDEDRLQQIWGNLRIRQVMQGDSGMYSCHGLSPYDESTSVQEDNHPKVYYSLFVHSPTDVRLDMNQNIRDKSWQLSCLAKNVHYEIPMVHVDGAALIDAISQMGTASSTNFYSNPINATIRIKSNYSGSVQCISRPAMDEAEIYGPGLERGRSHNLYVVNSPSRDHLIKQGPVNVTATVGDDVELTCLVIQRVNSKYWLKDGSYVPFGAVRTQRVGSNSLKIHKVEKKDEGCHVRATTIKDLVPNKRYQFRVKLLKDDKSVVQSNATSWMTVDPPSDDILPSAPLITSASLLSPTSAKLTWVHDAASPNAKARYFILQFNAISSESSHSNRKLPILGDTICNGQVLVMYIDYRVT